MAALRPDRMPPHSNPPAGTAPKRAGPRPVRATALTRVDMGCLTPASAASPCPNRTPLCPNPSAGATQSPLATSPCRPQAISASAAKISSIGTLSPANAVLRLML
ncbi:hypothetical protein NDU88_007277 [Pleurodeles waltl]|uniref:Uncharacterized protein n=1 Tax=Pleurodeles waltl TaxID=8319 RepID=A0AAV7VTC9_PLEWA|nr:hypothetical protein NDU88_007277 [Pleurodeles waltl]